MPPILDALTRKGMKTEKLCVNEERRYENGENDNYVNNGLSPNLASNNEWI